jgi:hypothetical protein
VIDYQDQPGGMVSPGGFEFGRVGWTWGEQRPVSITFFLDGTALVADQHGRPIKGTLGDDGVATLFATSAPELPNGRKPEDLKKFSTHARTIAALKAENYDWLNRKKIVWAGWPQLPYAELKKIVDLLPPTPLEELRKIRDPQLRKDSLAVRKEIDEVRTKELAATEAG